jgi:DNA-binding beta-propeller fold protein YncE
MKKYLIGVVCLTATGMWQALPLRAADATPLYTISKSIPLGAPDRWDYVTFDATSHRVYVAHGNIINVVDGRSGELRGQVDVPGANGIAVVPSTGKGYAGSRTTKSVIVFDLATLKVTKRLPADEDTDGVVYDPASRLVFVIEGDPQKLLAIDTRSDAVVARISLGGKPEFGTVDGKGKFYVNIADRREVQRIDTASARVDATWPIESCESPHGMSMDPSSERLFVSCLNAKLLVVDAKDGRIVATLPIGTGSDATAYDAKRKRAFSSNWDGTLSVIRVDGADKYTSLGDVPTQPLARTMAVDTDTGRVYLVTADRIDADPSATDPRKRFGVRPGSVRLLFADPGA